MGPGLYTTELWENRVLDYNTECHVFMEQLPLILKSKSY